jgi:adenosyl cobinamide kinase/adenosyl cobinamide phosphate guanylyltransferase
VSQARETDNFWVCTSKENSVKMTKTEYDPDRSLVLIEGLSHFITNFLQNLASWQTSLRSQQKILAHIKLELKIRCR